MCEYHAGYRRMLLFGSAKTSDVWSYGANQPARFDPFGNGCRGSAGNPKLEAAPNEAPWLGETFVAKLTSLPKTSVAVALFGLSSQRIGSVSLPLDLRVIGMGGCMLYQSTELTRVLATSNGTAPILIPLPMMPQLAGATFYAQGLVLDRAANPAGMTVSNAAGLHLGVK